MAVTVAPSKLGQASPKASVPHALRCAMRRVAWREIVVARTIWDSLVLAHRWKQLPLTWLLDIVLFAVARYTTKRNV